MKRFILCCSSLCVFLPIFSQQYVYIGPGLTNNWNNSSVWSTGQFPNTSSANVEIPSGMDNLILYLNSPFQAGNLVFNSAVQTLQSGTVAGGIAPGGSLSLNSASFQNNEEGVVYIQQGVGTIFPTANIAMPLLIEGGAVTIGLPGAGEFSGITVNFQLNSAGPYAFNDSGIGFEIINGSQVTIDNITNVTIPFKFSYQGLHIHPSASLTLSSATILGFSTAVEGSMIVNEGSMSMHGPLAITGSRGIFQIFSGASVTGEDKPLLIQGGAQFINRGTFSWAQEMNISGGSFVDDSGNFSIDGASVQVSNGGSLLLTNESVPYAIQNANLSLVTGGVFEVTGDAGGIQFTGNSKLFLDAQSFFKVSGETGSISSTACQSLSCPGSLQNFTYTLYLPNPQSQLQITVGAGGAGTGIAHQVMDFEGGFGTVTALTANGGCCYSSPGLGPSNIGYVGAISLFDSAVNQGSLPQLYDDPSSLYSVSWSDIPPEQVGFTAGAGPGFQSNGITYGVNGAVGLWVDVHSKHHSMGAVGSFQQTSNNQNTGKKMAKQRVGAQNAQSGSTVAFLANDLMVSNEIAQQLQVEQLAQRPLERKFNPWSVYVEPRGSFGQVFEMEGSFGTTFQTVGSRFGFDYFWLNQNDSMPVYLGFGFVGDYVHTWGQRGHHSGRFHSDEGFGSFYSTVVPKSIQELSLSTILGGGYVWYEFQRDVFENSQVIATGHTQGPECNAYFEMEYVFRHRVFESMPKNFRIAPIAALQYTFVQIDSYQETGAGRYDLAVEQEHSSTVSTLFGTRANYEFFAESKVTVRPELILLWQYQYLNPLLVTTAYPIVGVGPDAITSSLQGFPRNTLFAGADLRILMYDTFEIQLDYDFIYNQGFLSNVFYFELKGKF